MEAPLRRSSTDLGAARHGLAIRPRHPIYPDPPYAVRATATWQQHWTLLLSRERILSTAHHADSQWTLGASRHASPTHRNCGIWLSGAALAPDMPVG